MRAIQLQNKRVGSTFLQKAIDSHPDIIGIDEVFVNNIKQGIRKSGFVPYIRSDAESPKEYIEDIIYRTYPDNSTIFKLMYNQIEYHSGLLEYILYKNIPIIHLMRKNLVKQVISFINMAVYSHDPIVITPKNLLEEVHYADKLNKMYNIKMKNQIKLVLYYEDLIGESVNDNTYMKPNANIAVCDFFGIPQTMLFAKTKKKNLDDISVYLPNLDEIKRAFRGTDYEWMLY